MPGGVEESDGARSVLYCQVANQGQLYTAAVPRADFLAGHARAGGRLSSAALGILEGILSARTPGSTVLVGGRVVDTAAYCRARILDAVPDILRTAEPADLDRFDAVCFLVPQLADCAPQILDFLHRHATHPTPTSARWSSKRWKKPKKSYATATTPDHLSYRRRRGAVSVPAVGRSRVLVVR
ncbi:hypothetical protein [Kitasatospora sp. NPDC127116]|uniref:hypothetical protein n=1 Tax=Kitasatospora sp. NPDC127116 TaxID=3345367 RepID=UPI00363C3C20